MFRSPPVSPTTKLVLLNLVFSWLQIEEIIAHGDAEPVGFASVFVGVLHDTILWFDHVTSVDVHDYCTVFARFKGKCTILTTLLFTLCRHSKVDFQYTPDNCSLVGVSGVPEACRNHTYFSGLEMNNGVSLSLELLSLIYSLQVACSECDFILAEQNCIQFY